MSPGLPWAESQDLVLRRLPRAPGQPRPASRHQPLPDHLEAGTPRSASVWWGAALPSKPGNLTSALARTAGTGLLAGALPLAWGGGVRGQKPGRWCRLLTNKPTSLVAPCSGPERLSRISCFLLLPKVASSHLESGGWKGPAISTPSQSMGGGGAGSHTPAWGGFLDRRQPGGLQRSPAPRLPEQGQCRRGPACLGHAPPTAGGGHADRDPSHTPGTQWVRSRMLGGSEGRSAGPPGREGFPPPQHETTLDSRGIKPGPAGSETIVTTEQSGGATPRAQPGPGARGLQPRTHATQQPRQTQ